ncbi:MAG: hypothetical protein ABJL55_18025 [Roseibium sp.]
MSFSKRIKGRRSPIFNPTILGDDYPLADGYEHVEQQPSGGSVAKNEFLRQKNFVTRPLQMPSHIHALVQDADHLDPSLGYPKKYEVLSNSMFQVA